VAESSQTSAVMKSPSKTKNPEEIDVSHQLYLLHIIATAVAVASCSDDLPDRKVRNSAAVECSDATHCSAAPPSHQRKEETGDAATSGVNSKVIVIQDGGSSGQGDGRGEIGSFLIKEIPLAQPGNFSVQWSEAEKAQQYKVDIGLDAACQDVVKTSNSDAGRTNFHDVPAGVYYICVGAIFGDHFRAADNNGMEFEVRREWLRLADAPEEIPNYPLTGYKDGKVFVYGGRYFTQVNGSYLSSKGFTYDVVTDTWSTWPEEKTPANTGNYSFVDNKHWNGSEFLLVNANRTITAFDPIAMEEVIRDDIPKALPKDLLYGSVTYLAATNSYLARKRNDPTSGLYVYAPATQTWESWGDTNAPDTKIATSAATDDSLFLYGGFSKGDHSAATNGLWTISSTTKTWSMIEAPGAPQPFYTSTIHILGDELVVLGGFDYVGLQSTYTQEDLNHTISRFDLATQSWSTTTVEETPTHIYSSQIAIDNLGVMSFGGTKSLDIGNRELTKEAWFYYP
jgi:hypothetical protein